MRLTAASCGLFIITILGGCALHVPSPKIEITPDRNWKVSTQPYPDSAVCTLKLSATGAFVDGKISMESSKDENPTTVTLVDINSDTPSMVGNLGDQSKLIKIDEGATVYLIERTDMGNLNVFTLFRDKNILLLSKQYDFFSLQPFGLLMIGDCLSGI